MLEAALEAFPDAQLYALIYRRANFTGSAISRRPVHTSFIDRLPAGQAHHRAFLPLMPLAVERFDLRRFDVIVSFSYAVAHGVLTAAHQLHLAYIHTPLRYAWQQYPVFLSKQPPPARWALALYLHLFRGWDRAAAARPDRLVTVSHWMAGWVARVYRRQAQVLYPPVDVDAFQPRSPRLSGYVTLSRLVPHKRLDLVVEAFNQLGLPLKIIGEGPERSRLERLAGPNITFLGWQSPASVARLLGEARALVHAAEEDFGIAMVEAQAAGCPVIAFGRGASREIVLEGLTGEFFDRPEAGSLAQAVRQVECHPQAYDPSAIRRNALRFDRSRFLTGFTRLVEEGWAGFQSPHTAPTFPASPLEAPHAGRKVESHAD